MKPCKFSDLLDDTVPYIYPDIWQIEQTTGPERVVLAPSSHQVDLIIKLTQRLPEPFGILYVLTVPRGGSEPGRYQSAQPCDRKELEAFLERFRDYLEQDGRHHLWVISLPTRAQIIYDNHNILYGYEAVDEFVGVAEGNGLRQGDIHFPAPHAHHYNAEFDNEEHSILNYWEWKHFPLKDSD